VQSGRTGYHGGDAADRRGLVHRMSVNGRPTQENYNG
jgi:hypothetical protein